jgi:2-keto-4-pentenoate hydratase/2-oxohepta-3-ene-1,7-dioic acid hydratase in catechol pathway
MKLAAFSHNGAVGVGIYDRGAFYGRLQSDPLFPGDLDDMIRNAGADGFHPETLLGGPRFSPDTIVFRPPFSRSNKIICVGLNYLDHTAESNFAQPDYPTLFARFNTSLVGHGLPILRPRISDALDFEGELVAVIGRGGRDIQAIDALRHIAGYSVFNDGSIRDFQLRTTQWTVGKNFDATGAFGPVFVTADELPQGARGLHLETRLNGEIVQSSNTEHLIFDVATLVFTISQAMTLEPGDLIVTGTPSGIGHARNPRLYMKPGDIVEVEIEGIGTLTNSIADASPGCRGDGGTERRAAFSDTSRPTIYPARNRP